MAKFFKYIFWIFINFLYFINSGRIVGNIINHHNKPNEVFTNNMQTFCINDNKFRDPQCIIANKNNLIYCEKDRELFLEDNNFIKGKKLISISPGGLKGFYELGILSFIKENYDMDNYIFSGASAGAWNALFMCYKNDTKKFIYGLLDFKLSQVKSIKQLEYFLKYNLLSNFNSDDFDLKRLFIGVTTIKQFRKKTNIFSDFNSLEDAINCCIASSHIPLVTGGLTNRYHNMYTFDGGFSNYPYLNFTENVLHITPSMWKSKDSFKDKIMKPFRFLNIIYELFTITKNHNYMELFDHGYEDAKVNKELLDKIFLSCFSKNDTDNDSNTETQEKIIYPNSHLDLSKDNDSY